MTLRIAIALALMATLLLPGAAYTESPAERAERITEEGVTAARVGDYAAALARFEAAYALDPVPILLFHIGRVKARAGDHRGAVDSLARYLQAAPDEASRERAREALTHARRRLSGRLTIHSPVEGAVVEVDGEIIGRTPLARPVEVAPGEHAVRVVSASHLPFERTVELGPDEALDVSALLVATHERPPDEQGGAPDRTLTWLVAGAAAAALVAGGITAAVLLTRDGGGTPAADDVWFEQAALTGAGW